MSRRRIYLDHNATAPVRPEARVSAWAALEGVGNPSSVHAEGRAMRALLETARGAVASLLGAASADVTFTAGATEAANTILTPLAAADGRPIDRVLIGAGEHACVLDGHRFAAEAVTIAPLDRDGVLDLNALERVLVRHAGERMMLAVQAANNETGVVQPVAAAAARMRAAGGFTVCDAVQAAGRFACTLDALGADAVFISAHKMGGLGGAGALAVAPDRLRVTRLLRGGGQERGARAGTENAPAIAAFGAVCANVKALGQEASRLSSLREAFELGLKRLRPDAIIFGAAAERLANTSLFAIPDAPAEMLLIALDLGGVAVSSGAACSSGKVKSSHVLRAMGVEEGAAAAVRVSLGWTTQEADVEAVLVVLADVLGRLQVRRMQRAA